MAKVPLLMETVNLTRHNIALSDIKIFRGLRILLSGRFLAISPPDNMTLDNLYMPGISTRLVIVVTFNDPSAILDVFLRHLK